MSKKFISLHISLFIFFCTLFLFANSGNAFTNIGDINGNETVGIEEAVYALQVAAGQEDQYASLTGSWGKGYYPRGIENNGKEDYLSLTFYPSGYYIHYEDANEGSTCDDGGGVEIGTFIYTPTAQLLTIFPVFDQNGCSGLAEYGKGGKIKIKVIDDTLIFYDGDAEEISFERVKDDNNFLVGSWGPGYFPKEFEGGEMDFTSLTFYPNGYYIHYETARKSEPCMDGGGVEYGTYSYSPITQQLTVNPIVDQNGCVGLADDGQGGQIHITVNADKLTSYDNGVEDGSFERVK